MDRPKLEVADVFRRYGEAYRQEHSASLCTAQRRVLTAIEVCRTAVLGGHLEQCDHCGHQRNAYNSCGGSPLPKMPVVRSVQMAPAPSGRTRCRLPKVSQWCSIKFCADSSGNGRGLSFPRSYLLEAEKACREAKRNSPSYLDRRLSVE